MNIMLAILYGITSLVTLWAGGGGDIALFWQRRLALGLTLWILFLVCTRLSGMAWKSLIRFDRKTLVTGIGSGIALAIPSILFLWLVHNKVIPILGFLENSVEFLRSPHIGYLVIYSLLVIPAHELIWRGLIQPSWGLWGTAFLAALNIGFGTQYFLPFAVNFALGGLWGLLAKQFGATAAALSHAVWALVTLSALIFF